MGVGRVKSKRKVIVIALLSAALLIPIAPASADSKEIQVAAPDKKVKCTVSKASAQSPMRVPAPENLNLGGLARERVWILTDGCPAATKFRRLFAEAIADAGKRMGLTDEQIVTYTADCWQHMRCVWGGASRIDLKDHMTELLLDDLRAIHPMLRVTADIGSLCLAVEKYFSLQANYVKVMSQQ